MALAFSAGVTRWYRWLSGFLLVTVALTASGAVPEGCERTRFSAALSAASASHASLPSAPDGGSWFALRIHNPSKQACTHWLEGGAAGIRDARLFVPTGEEWQVSMSGADLPPQAWPVAARAPVFELVVPANASMEAWLWISRSAPSLASRPTLWTPPVYLQAQSRHALVNGAIYGAMLLLVISCLALALIYRLPALGYMALGVGCYTLYIAIRDNYFLIHVWPQNVEFNLWARYLLLGLTFYAGSRYVSITTKVDALPVAWRATFEVVQSLFLCLALFGGLHSEAATIAVYLSIDMVLRLLRIPAVIIGFRGGTLHGWYPPTLVALLWLQVAFTIISASHAGTPRGSAHWLSTTVLTGGVLLLGTLISQMRAGRRRELHAWKLLDDERANEQVRLEALVAQRTDALSQALAARRQLLASISHDLRAPLAAMLGRIRSTPDHQLKQDDVEFVERFSRQQMEMIDELLEFSRLDMNAVEIEPSPTYVYAFLEDIIEQARFAAEQNGNTLQTTIGTDLPAVAWLDARHLRQVLNNLLVNAAKFTHNGSVHLKVHCTGSKKASAGADTQCVRFTIQDTGRGLPDADKQNLVKPFWQGKTRQRQQGVGLGLSITSGLLERMGSTLMIESIQGRGSSFSFELALRRGNESQMDYLMPDTASADLDGHGLRVLVVDDEQEVCWAVCDMLNSYGFDCHASCSGDDAREQLAHAAFDIILTDQQMSNGDGWLLLSVVRKLHPGLPVVLHSATPAFAPAGHESQSFDAVLQKPATSASLIRTLLAVGAGSIRNAA